MSGLGPGDTGEVKQATALFVQRGDPGPPGGLGPGLPDKNTTCVSVSVRFGDRLCFFSVCVNVQWCLY